MVPSLSIVYNSQSGNGLLGQGWNLSGLSVITRAGWDEYHHAKTMPVTMTSADALVLDGTYLYPKTGTYGTVGATYHTEAESYAVITSISAGGSDQYFNVVQKDGTLLQYGNSADSRMMSDDGTKVMMWRLNMIQDINGNYIWFTYTNTDRDSRISQIKYTGNWNTGMLPYNEINFVYNIRSDQNKVYEAGYSLQSKYLLTQVEVKGEGEVFRLYQLEYGKKDEVSYLRNITEFNERGGESLNDTRFKYGAPTSDLTEIVNTDNIVSNPSSIVSTGDFDGDGLSDLMVVEYATDGSGNTYNTVLKIKKRSATSSTYATISTLNFSGTGVRVENTYKQQSSTQRKIIPGNADFNGDGRDDIIVSNYNTFPASSGGTVNNLEYVRIYYANADGSLPSTPSFTYTPPTASSAIIKGSEGQENYLYVGDFDGDGRADLITMLGGHIYFHSPAKGVTNKDIARVNLYTGVFPSSLSVFDWLYKEGDQVFVVNMDGDAKSDLMVVTDNTTRVFTFNFEASVYDLHMDQVGQDMVGYPTTWHDIYPGDFNGDGKTDILTGPIRALEDDKNTWEIAYSNGKKFVEPKPFIFDHIITPWHPGYSSTDKLVIGDFNGDGKSDITDFSVYYSPEYITYYSTGSEFRIKKNPLSKAPQMDGFFAVGDYNGDMRAELFWHTYDPLYFMYGQQMFTSFNRGDLSHLLEEVTDGFNRPASFNHKLLPYGTGIFYSKGSGETYPVNNIQPALYVVTNMSSPDGIGGMRFQDFQYENLRAHRAGRGLLGFEKIKASDIIANTRSETIFDLDRTYYVPWLKTSNMFLVSPATHLSHQDNNASLLMNMSYGAALRAGAASPYVMLGTGSTAQDFQQGVTTVTSNTYDGYIVSGSYSGAGNITQGTTSASGGPEAFTTTVQTSYVAAGPSPVPSRPSEVTTTTQRGTKAAVASRSTFSYYTNGLLREEVTAPVPAPALYQKDRFEYDAYGNVTLTEKSTL